MKVTYYLEVISSWCHWAEPTWAELQARYAGRVQFAWRIALMRPQDFPVSPAQADWFYRRSGTIARAPYMLSHGWLEGPDCDYAVPNLVAEAARSLGATGDTVRHALTHAAVREGRKVARLEEAVAIAAAAGQLDPALLRARATSPEIRATVDASTAEFHSLQITQRPAFVLDDPIGDRAVFSGLIRLEPLVATLEAMLADTAAYATHRAHFGDPPAG
ncbi:MAG TPA: disulfide bond formation protein DsbA [Opitutaceae bacterium]|nr:disulfide bond formation protein DsbA [Opitutaceae bacterium]